MKDFCIVYSNYTMQLFAWEGTAKENKRYLGNRSVVACVKSITPEEAMSTYRASIDTRPPAQHLC